MPDGARGPGLLAILVVLILVVSVVPARANHRPVLRKTDWLSVVNFYRATAGLAPVSENRSWSYGARLHSRYLVWNQTTTHYEQAGRRGYTYEGAAAGRNGNVVTWAGTDDGGRVKERELIEDWMKAPFHAAGIVHPGLRKTGFGLYRDRSRRLFLAATLDVLRGRASVGTEAPVVWPADGMQVPLRVYPGREIPEPLEYCPGYRAPTGLGIVVIPPRPTSLRAHSIRSKSKFLEHCAFQRDGVHFLLPRKPLKFGHRYEVSVRTTEHAVSWWFTVGEVRPPHYVAIDPKPFNTTFQTRLGIEIGWKGLDRQSGIGSFDVRTRSGVIDQGLGPPQWWRVGTKERNGIFTGTPGTTSCFAVRATDNAGNHSHVSKERCANFPLDVTRLKASAGWVPDLSSSYYSGTAMRTFLPDATLRTNNVRTRQLAVLVTRCPGCGQIDVLFDDEQIATIDLNAMTEERSRLVRLKPFSSARTGVVTLKVASVLQPVTIEGLGVLPH